MSLSFDILPPETLELTLQPLAGGAAPEDLDEELDAQESLIDELKAILQEKASGSADPVIEALSITENGTYTAPDGVDGYSPVTVGVPIPEGYIIPSGTKEITENGTIDVTQYASAEVNVQGGGASLIELVTRSVLTFSNETLTEVGRYAFAGCSDLTTVDLPNVETVGGNAFASCSQLSDVSLPRVKALPGNVFNGSGSMPTSNFPSVETIGASAFTWSRVETLRFPNLKSINGSFLNATRLHTLIIEQSETVCTNGATSTFNGTPIKNGTGYVYVPSALLAEYQAATNWAAISSQIRALEDYTVDGTITGELDPDKI